MKQKENKIDKKWFILAFIVGVILIYYFVYVQNDKGDKEKIDIAMTKFEQSKTDMNLIMIRTEKNLISTYDSVVAWNKEEEEINSVERDLEEIGAKKELIQVQGFQEQLPGQRAEMTQAMTKRMDDRILALKQDYDRADSYFQREAINEALNNHYGWLNKIIEQASYLGKGDSIPKVTTL